MKLFLLLFLSLALASCYHVYYSPNTPNVPMLSKKNDIRINALYSYGGASDSRGGELQFAYALRNNFAVMVNGFSAGRTENTGSYEEKGSGTYVEAGAGYFKKLGQKGGAMGELYGGAGFGTVNNDYGLSDRSSVGIFKLFLQPSIGIKSRYFEAAFVPRINYVNWRVKEDRIKSSENDYAKYELQLIRDQPSQFFIEPALLLRGGGEQFKVQTGFTISSMGKRYSDLSETVNFHLGISINVNAGKKKM